MKLLLDHHLSHKLVRKLADVFPDSTQTRLLGLGTAIARDAGLETTDLH